MPYETLSEQENSRKKIPDLLGKIEIPDIEQVEKEKNQDKKEPLSWNAYLGDPSMRSRHKDKNENQVTTTGEKEDNTDSTAIVTTSAFTTGCEMEWGDDITERLAETTTSNNQIYVFGNDDG